MCGMLTLPAAPFRGLVCLGTSGGLRESAGATQRALPRTCLPYVMSSVRDVIVRLANLSHRRCTFAHGAHTPLANVMSTLPTSSRAYPQVGEDKTARVIGRYHRTDTWHEIARPVVHGHALRCAAFLGTTHAFLLGSEEKIVRLYDAPTSFLASLCQIAGHPLPIAEAETKTKTQAATENEADTDEARPWGAALPPLGLSNQPLWAKDAAITDEQQQGVATAADADDDDQDEGDDEGGAASTLTSCSSRPRVLDSPPLEEHLTQHTLWPERAKLYGAAAEVTAVACSRDGCFAAAASAGGRAGTVSICVWRVAPRPSASHTPCMTVAASSAVTSLAVGSLAAVQYRLVSAHRDGSLTLVRWRGDDVAGHTVTRLEGAHTAPVTCCDFSWDGTLLATCSGVATAGASSTSGGEVAIWGEEGGALEKRRARPVAAAATALAWGGGGLLAVGDASGTVTAWRVDGGGHFGTFEKVEKALHSGSSVLGLSWCRDGDGGEGGEASWLLASCSCQMVKIMQLQLQEV
eukprot:TRINITY_DN1960_c0_g4_i6.p1 TRINITY_DN1960_c0_g4~~TRINITY_DN1960_c0_g4_i6.p1  ORF type:complete len:521 (+),score=97.61 TRINITY_DN1960_c0_g4_i6:1097-2659(+)